MPIENDHVRGKDSIFRLFQDGTEVQPLPVESWDITRVADTVAEGVNGENRDRITSVTKHYSCTATLFVNDANVLIKLLEDQQNKDDLAVPLDKTAGVSFRIVRRGGARVQFICQQVELDAWKLSSGGRTSSLKLSVPMRFLYFVRINV